MDHEVNGAVLDEQSPQPSPSPRPSPRPRSPLGSLFFSGSEPETPEGPDSPPATEPTEQDAAGSDSGAGWTSDPDESLPGTSSPASSADGGLKPLGKAALRATTAQAVLIGSAMAHRIAARTEGQKLVGLYLADDDDAKNIGDPLANIAHRRGGIAGKISEDANDGMQALMGVANYFVKQVTRVQHAREVDQHLAAGGTLGDLQAAG